MSGESLMSRHLGSVSRVRRSRAYRSVARVAIAGQLLTLLPPMTTKSAAQPAVASLVTAAAARAAREADEKLAQLQLPPGALLSDAAAGEVSAPNSAPLFTAAWNDEAIETLLGDYLLGAEQRGTSGASDRQGDRPARPVPPVPEPKRVVVNRTVPRVTPRATEPTLSTEPADREFFDARIFDEPLVPTGATTAEDNRALAQVLRHYVAGRNRENVSQVLAHLQRFPASPWRASLLANIGTVFNQHGYYTRAFESWNSAWQLTKDATDPRVRAVADYAIAEWLDLMSLFGDVAALEGKLKELDGRMVTGSTGARIKVARQGLWVLKNHHEWATPSARTALASWLYIRSPGYARERARAEMTSEAAAAAERTRGAEPLGALDPDRASAFRMPKALSEFHARAEGTSLRELANLATASGLRVRSGYRPAGAPLVTPAIVHLNARHYSLVVKQEEGRVLLRDAILGGEFWMSLAALEEESSGYWLIPEGPLPDDWRAVQDDEANAIIGRCYPGGPDDDDPGCPCGSGGAGAGGPGGPGSAGGPSEGGAGGGCANPGSCPPSRGMPTHFFHPTSAALRLVDTPVGYAPPRGPSAFFTVSYHHRNNQQPSTFTFSNLGPLWTVDWQSYVQEMPAACGAMMTGCYGKFEQVYLRGYGAEHYRNADANGVYPAFWRSRAVLVKVSESPVRFERRLPDGSVEVFTQADGAPSGQRRVFLTSVVDPQGQTLQLTYDAQVRLVALTDALGQVTTVAYEHPTDPLKITKVTDPFGRFATFTYTPAGQLASITDVLGLTSSFTYERADFISALTTPYGITVFREERSGGYPMVIEATDPLGGTERLEYHMQNTSVPNAEPVAVVPTGFSAYNEILQWYTTYYWSKRQWALHPGDFTKATQTQWLLYDSIPDNGPTAGKATSIPRSIKKPLENRVWYAYPGQGANTRFVGSWSDPERIGRVLDDGSSQITEKTYNTSGRALSVTDPTGRRKSFTYAANGTDLLEVRQTTGALNDLLATYGNYTAGHRPQTATDAAGQITTATYNAAGQVLAMTNAKSETTTYGYDSNGYLQSVTGPVTGSTTTYTYDARGRLLTKTTPDGYALAYEYDDFDRQTKVTYPDGTVEQYIYDRLDAVETRDRQGRSTRFFYDALRRQIMVRDSLGQTLTQQWCNCGSLEAFVDGKGQKTAWERDLQDRITRESRPDGTTDIFYTYEATTSRLKTVTDPKLQVTTYTYGLDGAVTGLSFTNSVIATPSISFTYDPAYSRHTTMSDGTGVTTFTYHPVGGLGANKPATVDGPLTNDTIAFAYDELGRLVSRMVDGVGLTRTYDALGRTAAEVNPLGTFTFAYDGHMERLASLAYPNGQTSTYSYLGNLGDHRLQTIHHQLADTTTLSKFDYTYAPAGAISTWQQQTGSAAATLRRHDYDAMDQLRAAIDWSTGPSPAMLKRYLYDYDTAGNRTTEQVDDAVTQFSYTALNRLDQRSPGGMLRFAGSVSEPARVTVNGREATVDAANAFSAKASVPAGATNVVVNAIDSSGNSTAATYQVTASGATTNYTFDANGNMTGDGTRTFEWDARNQLVAVAEGTHRSEFTYDGFQRRVRIVELDSSVVVSDTRFVWCDSIICEERAANGTTVLRRPFGSGEEVGGVNHLFTADHLGSVREVTDDTGALLARYAFDPYGRRTVISGTDVTTRGFTGHRWNDTGELWLTHYRSYDAGLARWSSEDPLSMHDGPNMYAYVGNGPASRIDPRGLLALPTDKNVGIGGNGAAHFGFAGITAGCGVSIDTGLTACMQCFTCYRLGMMAMLAAGMYGSLGVGRNSSGWNCTVGFGADVNSPKGGGGVSVAVWPSQSAMGGAGRMGLGMGISVGIEVCCTYSWCKCLR